MKLPSRALQIFWDLHAWVGVVASMLLHVMFLTGGVSLFRHPIELWQEPGLHRSSALALGSLQQRLDGALAASATPPSDFWLLLQPTEPVLDRILYESGGDYLGVYLTGEGGKALPERERLGDFLYQLHFLYLDGATWLEYVAAILGVLMLVAIVTGVLIHLHNLVRQFHQFRVDKGRRVIWSDLHKVLGVTGLPFQVLYAFTGAIILIGPVLVDVQSWAPSRAQAEARSAEIHALARIGHEEPPAPTGEPSEVLSMDALVAIARREIDGLEPEVILVHGHGKSDGWLSVRGATEQAPLSTSAIWLRERDGAVLQRAEARSASAYEKSSLWLSSVHYAHYCGSLLKVFLALLAIATSITIVSGNAIWLTRRREKEDTRSYRALERLTVGAGGGAAIAVAACFCVSRIVPLGSARHHAAEEIAFFGALVLAIVISFAIRRERLVALWWQQLAVAGALFAIVPLLAARWSSAGIFGGAAPRVGTVVAVDAGLLVTGLALLFVAHRIRARDPQSRAQR